MHLFGEHFDPDSSGVDRVVYLKPGSYVLYTSGATLYLKSLRDEGSPVEVLNGCMLVSTKSNFVFAVKAEDDCSSIYLWVDDERFMCLGRMPYEITAMDFEDEDRILMLARHRRSPKFHQLENNILHPLEGKRMETMQSCVEVMRKQGFHSLDREITSSPQFRLCWLLSFYRMEKGADKPQPDTASRAADCGRNLRERVSNFVSKKASAIVQAVSCKVVVNPRALLPVEGALCLVEGFPFPYVVKRILPESSLHSVLDLPL